MTGEKVAALPVASLVPVGPGAWWALSKEEGLAVREEAASRWASAGLYFLCQSGAVARAGGESPGPSLPKEGQPPLPRGRLPQGHVRRSELASRGGTVRCPPDPRARRRRERARALPGGAGARIPSIVVTVASNFLYTSLFKFFFFFFYLSPFFSRSIPRVSLYKPVASANSTALMGGRGTPAVPDGRSAVPSRTVPSRPGKGFSAAAGGAK